MVIVLIVAGIISGILGLCFGYKVGFWGSTILAAVVLWVLMTVPMGVLIAEFPIGLFIGGVVGGLLNKNKTRPRP
jgi:hypothetical protein